ncbi:MAG: hypothetical protein HY901_00685, partial [Deltaproteobacteria bacterium]|nr:hypothetical protein [Deltaproteobacteria bacterium]
FPPAATNDGEDEGERTVVMQVPAALTAPPSAAKKNGGDDEWNDVVDAIDKLDG